MGDVQFELDFEAAATAVSTLKDLNERNKEYDVADYTPNGEMVEDPTVVAALDRFNTAWDQGLNGMLRDVSQAHARLSKVISIYYEYMTASEEAMRTVLGKAQLVPTDRILGGGGQ